MAAFPILLTKQSYDPTSGRMLYRFSSTQTFSNKEVALVACSFYNSFFNISAAFANNTIIISFPTGNFSGGTPTYVTKTLTLADGYYSIDTLNQAMQNWFVNEKLYYYDSGSGMNVYFVQFQTNATLYAAQLNNFLVPTVAQAITNGWVAPASPGWTPNAGTHFAAPRVQISAGLSALLGIAAGTYPTPAYTSATWSAMPHTAVGTAAPAINMVSGLIMRTNLISQSTGYPVDMLALVPITSQFGAVTQFVAPHPVFSPIPNGRYNTIEITFMDQSLRPVKLYDPDITITLEIRDQQITDAF